MGGVVSRCCFPPGGSGSGSGGFVSGSGSGGIRSGSGSGGFGSGSGDLPRKYSIAF